MTPFTPDFGFSSAITLSTIYGVGFLALMVLGFVLFMLFVGVILYYFTGQKPGKSIITNMMGVVTRTYLQIGILGSIFLSFLGAMHVVKSILGAIFPIFTYGFKGVESVAQRDLITGLLLVSIGSVLFAMHYYLNQTVESTAQKKGTLITKAFVGLGLFSSGAIFVFTTINFLFEVASFLMNGAAQNYPDFGYVAAASPGSTLATLVTVLPIWLYFYYRATSIMRYEK